MKFFIALIFLILVGCDDLSGDRANKLKVNERFKQSIQIGNIKVATTILPGDKISGENINTGYDTISNGGEGLLNFNVMIEKQDAIKVPKEKQLYLDYDMQKDFVLVDNGDTLMPVFCHRIENGRINNYEYILSFEKKNDPSDKNFTLFYNDNIFGIGSIAFPYKDNN